MYLSEIYLLYCFIVLCKPPGVKTFCDATQPHITTQCFGSLGGTVEVLLPTKTSQDGHTDQWRNYRGGKGWQLPPPKKCLPPHLPPRLLEVSPIYIYWMVLYFLLLKLLISLVTCLSLRTKIFMSPLPCKMVESMNPICSLLTVRICRFIQMKTETVWKPKNWRQANSHHWNLLIFV